MIKRTRRNFWGLVALNFTLMTAFAGMIIWVLGSWAMTF
jgi:hypothetical protein